MTRSPAIDTAALLAWYDSHARELPWRVSPAARQAGVAPEPYHVWLSEIMLQQTTVAAVGPYFRDFLRRWPTLDALANAADTEVMAAWAGLGYYSRARNLKKCAEQVTATHGGVFPTEEAALRALPGIGPYTAAAIAAIAFDQPATVVDGNVERVVARLFAVDTPLPAAKPTLRRLAETLTPQQRPGDFAQAMMDLGATVCTPTKPACGRCPLNAGCSAAQTDNPALFPFKAPKTPKPQRFGVAFVATRPDGAVLLRRRRPRGLLGGMTEVPTSAWSQHHDRSDDLSLAPVTADWQRVSGTVSHVFTHFRLELDIYTAVIAPPGDIDGHWWSRQGGLRDEALPTVMRKVIAHALGPDLFKPR